MDIHVQHRFVLTDVVPDIYTELTGGLTLVLGDLELQFYHGEARDLAVQILAALAEDPPADPSVCGVLRAAVRTDVAVRDHLDAHEDCTDECAVALDLCHTHHRALDDALAVLQTAPAP